jgi:hypothetical protein
MISIIHDLSSEIENLELVIFSDEHIGDPFCDMNFLKERIEYVKNNENVYCLLNGDIMDNATTTSVGDTYSQTYSPDQQIDIATELFMPIKDKILGITKGNHEHRTYKKEGIDIMKAVARNLGCLSFYSNTALLLFIKFGTCKKKPSSKMMYSVYMKHGAGGGLKEGAKAIRLADMANIVDADVYVHSHTHLAMALKEDFMRVDRLNCIAKPVTKLFVNTSANLNYGGYGETIGCKPASKDKPIICLSGHCRDLKAIV